MEDKSFEQLSETFRRQVYECRTNILEQFFVAYAANLMKDGKQIDISDICLVEYQCEGATSFNRKYWFEYKPLFPELEYEEMPK